MLMDLFRTPLINRNNKNTETALTIFEDIKATSPSRVHSNRGGYQSRPVTTEEGNKIFSGELMDPILEEIKNVYELEDRLEFRLQGAWFNENQRGNYNNTHMHPRCHFAFVWYLKVPRELKRSQGGKVVFDHPDKAFTMSGFSHLKCTGGHTFNPYHRDTCVYNPEEGDLIAFPSHLMHRVEPYSEDLKRISIAFNGEFFQNDK